METKPISVQNLLLIRKGDQLLLAMKKRGFGKGWWNGYGGKVVEGETIEEALVREVREESGLTLKSQRKIGFLRFENIDKFVDVHFYEAKDFEGDLIETEEMAPKWFSVADLPYSSMWPTDPMWYKLYLAGKLFSGEVVFDENHAILKCDIHEAGEI